MRKQILKWTTTKCGGKSSDVSGG